LQVGCGQILTITPCALLLDMGGFSRPTSSQCPNNPPWALAKRPHRSQQQLVLAQELCCSVRGGGLCDQPVSAHADYQNGPFLVSQPATPGGWQCLGDPQAALKGPRSCSGASPLRRNARHRGLASPNRPKTRAHHQSSYQRHSTAAVEGRWSSWTVTHAKDPVGVAA